MSSPNMTPSELYPYLNEFRLQNKFHDVVIKVDDRTFHCHRIILASAFEYFRNMFCKNFAEAEKKEIELKGINANDFELLLIHIYGGSVCLNDENSYRLFKMAHYLCLQTLEDKCVKYFLDNVETISLNIAIYIFIFASKVKKTILLEKFAGCMAKNFEHVSENVKFLRVAATDLLKVLSHRNLHKNSLVVLDFLEKWMQFQSDGDKEFLSELLNAVDFKVFPKEWCIRKLTLQNSASRSSVSNRISIEPSCEITKTTHGEEQKEILFIHGREDEDETILELDKTSYPFYLYTRGVWRKPDVGVGPIYDYKIQLMHMVSSAGECNVQETLLTRTSSSFAGNYRSVFVNELHYLICNHEEGNTEKYYNYYDVSIHCALKMKKRLPTFEYNTKHRDVLNTLLVTACNSNIYLYTDGKLIMFDCLTHEWIELSVDTNNFEKTAYPNLVSYKDNLYLIGGKSSPVQGPLDVSVSNSRREKNGRLFQRFDTRAGKWSQMPTLMYPRSKSASYVLDDTLYVTGGDDLAYLKGYIECFDFRAGKWYELPTTMPEPKLNHILLAYDDRLWFFGGQKYSDSNLIVEDLTWYSYNLKENVWSDVSKMSQRHKDFSIQKILDVIIIPR